MKTFLLNRRQQNEETGFTVAEIMIAAIVILIVTVSAAYGISNAIKSTIFVENSSKANQLANQQIAIAKQAPFRQLWVARTANANLIGTDKCAVTTTAAPSGTTWATTGLATGDAAKPQYPGLEYCFAKRFKDPKDTESTGIGTTFYVQTTIAYINTNAAYDGATLGNVTSTNYKAKRVTVTVTWRDIASGEGTHSIQQTYTRTPNMAECIPDTVTSTGAPLITGCRP